MRWRACDLILRLHEEFGLSVSDDTIYRALKELGRASASLVFAMRLPSGPTNMRCLAYRFDPKRCISGRRQERVCAAQRPGAENRRYLDPAERRDRTLLV